LPFDGPSGSPSPSATAIPGQTSAPETTHGEFDDLAKTEALPEPAPESESPPKPSPTKFDIDVATSLKNASGSPPDDNTPLALPPTTTGEGEVQHERDMAKTAYVDMAAELSDGTGMIKLVAIATIVLATAIGVLYVLR